MKINGKVVDGPSIGTVAIPRGDDYIVFRMQAILDESEFNTLCPMPQAPEVVRPGNVRTRDVTDPTFKAAVAKWAKQKTDWRILKSLEITEGLEWDTVVLNDPETWSNWEKDLSSCFTDGEINVIINKVFEICGLNQDKIEKATERFLADQAATPEE